VTALDLPRRMSVAEFLEWYPHDGVRRELVDGQPVAQDAASPDHASLVVILGIEIGARLRAPRAPCRSETGSGVEIADLRDTYTYLIPDLLVRCGQPAARDGEPVVVAEVLSPSNSAAEIAFKVSAYKAVPSIREIVVLRQDAMAGVVHRRLPDGWTDALHVSGADGRLVLESLEAEIPLPDLYADVLPAG